MSAKIFHTLVLIFIACVFIGVFSMISYLVWTTYKEESMCREYYKGNTAYIQKLILEKSIGVDDGCPFPFLAFSTKIGDTAMVRFLVENGADINQKFTYKSPKTHPYTIKHTPLFYAINDKYELKRLNQPLEIDEKYITSLEILIQHGASLSIPCGREYKPSATDSLKTVYRKESPDAQTALDLIRLINHPLLNNFAKRQDSLLSISSFKKQKPTLAHGLR